MERSEGVAAVCSSSIYSEVLRAIAVPFGDLAFFTDAEKPLVVNLESCQASSIRISLKGTGELKLAGIEIFSADDPAAPGGVARVASAELRTSGRPDEASDLTLSSDPRPQAPAVIAVERTDEPWVVLDFGAPKALRQIKIWSKAMPRQAWSPLRVEISQDGLAWEVVYSTKDRLAAQANLLAAISDYANPSIADPYAWSVFVDAVALLLTGLRRDAEKRLKGSSLSKEVMMEMRQAITRHVLDPMHMEWNHHGVRRTFRYWTSQEKVRYIKTANAFIAKLREHLSPHVCLGFGSVLSLVRDQDLIPHDDDLDIIIAFNRSECPTLTEGFKRLVSFAAQHGYMVRGYNSKSHRQFIRKGTKKVDVFVGLQEGDRISWFPQKRRALSMSDVFPPIPAKLLGVECLIPANPIRYLESVYGPKWSKPDPGFSHSWRTTAYDDIL